MTTEMTTSTALARTAATPEDYARLGLGPRDRVAAWEDAARTDNAPGSYEWWYFDAHLDDGATLVAVFMNKPLSEAQRPLTPLLRLNLELPDGRVFDTVTPFPVESWSASTERLDVRIGDNTFSGTLDEVRIHATHGDVSIDVTLTPEVRAWRPETGHMYFGEGTDRLFAWLPTFPQGRVTGTYAVDGETRPATGVGYHDHNWGDVPLPAIIHDWYWGRGQAGPYSTITSCTTANEQYGYAPLTTFLLARDGAIVADDASRVRFEVEDVYTDELTGKPVATTTRYRYVDGPEEYTVTYVRERDLSRSRMLDGMPPEQRAAAEAAGFDGAYLRFAGSLTIDHRDGGVLVDSFREDAAVWELMYFGAPRAPEQCGNDDEV